MHPWLGDELLGNRVGYMFLCSAVLKQLKVRVARKKARETSSNSHLIVLENIRKIHPLPTQPKPYVQRVNLNPNPLVHARSDARLTAMMSVYQASYVSPISSSATVTFCPFGVAKE